MSIRITQIAFGAATLAASIGFASLAPAQAQTAIQQCSAKYQEAKTANTLGGQSWNQFRTKCQADLKAQPAAATSPAPAATPAAAPANPLKPAPAPAATTAAAPKPAAPAAAAAPSNAVFPSAIDAKYSKESAGKAREHTCLDQYKANKATNGNGGLNWIQKGGGYYSQCNTRLKG